MGLDGISINQLRAVPERTSAELNSTVQLNQSQSPKAVDGLSQGQRVDPDRENEHEKQEFEQNSNSENQEESQEEPVQTIKYDLSNASKFILKTDEENKKIMIVEKSTDMVLQTIDAEELSTFVAHTVNSQGSLVNKKF